MISTACSGCKFLAYQKSLQVLAFQILHGDEFRIARHTQIENADDVAMRDLPGEYQLPLKTLEYFLMPSQFGTDHLESDGAVELAI